MAISAEGSENEQGSTDIQSSHQDGESVQDQGWQARLLGWLPKFGQRDTEDTKDTGDEGQASVDEVVVPKDLPLDAIAAEVQVCAHLTRAASKCLHQALGWQF